jgi:hypothetical protein
MNLAPVSAFASCAVGILTNANPARIAKTNENLFIQLISVRNALGKVTDKSNL